MIGSTEREQTAFTERNATFGGTSVGISNPPVAGSNPASYVELTKIPADAGSAADSAISERKSAPAATVHWLPCPGDARLEVSDRGQVRHVATGRMLAVSDRGIGYLYVTIRINGRPTGVRVNRLVATAFHRPPVGNEQAAHLNGVRGDNRACNLEWKTPAANAADRRTHGTQVKGERINTAVLTADAVAQIKRGMAAGESDATLAARHGVRRQSVNKIRTGRAWKHVPGPEGIANPAGRRRRAAAAELAGSGVAL